MPRIMKLVHVHDGLGVVLDIPQTGNEIDSVTILTDEELADVKRRVAREAAAVCRDLAVTADALDALNRAASEIENLY